MGEWGWSLMQLIYIEHKALASEFICWNACIMNINHWNIITAKKRWMPVVFWCWSVWLAYKESLPRMPL